MGLPSYPALCLPKIFRCFFVPYDLSADSDLKFFQVLQTCACGSFFFLAIFLLVTLRLAFYKKGRLISFGFAWFFLALLPTSSLIL